MDTPVPFWMVYGIGQNAPKARHKTHESAVFEAKRLARANPDIEFYVLASVALVVKRDVDVVGIAVSDDGIPF